MTIRSQITIPTSIFQPHTPQSLLPTYHPYSITHTTQHTVATTHSPSQLHLLYTQNSLNTPQITGPHPQLFPYSASSISATAWSHSTPQTLTVYKAVASCENCETISGDYKSAMAQVTCTMEYGICTHGLRLWEDILLPSGTNPIQLETHGIQL